MLKSCKYCNRVHDSKFDCGHKPKRKERERNDKDRFRSSRAWQCKRDEIRQRDLNLCQICIRNMYGTVDRYSYDDLSVHHAVGLDVDYNKRLDNDNLLTMCNRHHDMADAGIIPLDVVQGIIQEQENGKKW